jgi:hypothetical protein
MLTPDAFVLIRPNAWSCERQIEGPRLAQLFRRGDVYLTPSVPASDQLSVGANGCDKTAFSPRPCFFLSASTLSNSARLATREVVARYERRSYVR